MLFVTSHSAACGGIITEPSGVITSPNYPQDYDRNLDCAWLLRAPAGMVIKVSIGQIE